MANIKQARNKKSLIKKEHPTLKLMYKHRMLLSMLIPVILYFFIFKYGPMYGIIMAFKDYYPVKGLAASEWVGLKHFDTLFNGLYFMPVLKNTILISLYGMFWGFPAPIILAIILNEIRNKKFKKITQTISYLPHFLSWVIVAGVFIEFLSPSRGFVNFIITSLGFEPIYFVTEPAWFRTILVGTSVWKGIGWGSIIYLAAISGIDPQLYEVAEIDGASRLRKIWNITIPAIVPVIVIMLIFSSGKIIDDNFQQIYNFLNPRVLRVGDVIETYTYEQGLKNMQYSYATAVGLFKNVISFSMVLITNYIAKRTTEYALW
ncbi:ABC transporter permease [Vallitalea okinawensis]|uniref:ABC transporter permease n=1 Tax=Vallitalea okinawensis TaxID=2078660 RepID=UPI001FA8D894|nr:ABC transporter permease subunit [Vallitalea okinawensis]